jgi:hypothetical protein
MVAGPDPNQLNLLDIGNEFRSKCHVSLSAWYPTSFNFFIMGRTVTFTLTAKFHNGSI